MDEYGNVYHYSLEEVPVNGYKEPEVSVPALTETANTNDYAYTVTNTLDTAVVTVEKIWSDQDNRYGLRPEELTLTLRQNDADMVLAPAPAVTRSDSTWTYVWTGVPVEDAAGEPYSYSVEEKTIPTGYSDEIDQEVDIDPVTYSAQLTNELETVDVTATKYWDDNSDEYQLRPDTLTLTLYQNNTVMANAPDPAVDSDGDTWTYVWSDLPARGANGVAYAYTVKEDPANLPDGYRGLQETVSATEDGFEVEITNVLNLVELTIMKEWVDEDTDVANRPSSVTMTLLNMTEGGAKRVTLSATGASSEEENLIVDSGDWWAIVRVANETADGVQISYRWDEGDVDGYKQIAYDSDGISTTITNEKMAVVPEGIFTLTVNYVYLDGSEAAESVVEIHAAGEDYNVVSPVIEGYIASMPVVFGVMPSRDVIVTVIYVKPGEIIDDYGTALGLGDVYSNLGECFE